MGPGGREDTLMPRIDYTGKLITGKRREMVQVAERICAELAADGYDLTLRQLYYQFVAHDLFPDDRTWQQVGKRWVRDPNGTKNAEPNYTWLGGSSTTPAWPAISTGRTSSTVPAPRRAGPGA